MVPHNGGGGGACGPGGASSPAAAISLRSMLVTLLMVLSVVPAPPAPAISLRSMSPSDRERATWMLTRLGRPRVKSVPRRRVGARVDLKAPRPLAGQVRMP
jgi:hypothetical protein